MNVNVADITIALLLDQNSIYTKSRSEMFHDRYFHVSGFTYPQTKQLKRNVNTFR